MPIIFIPGIKGSELVDTYPIDFEVRWSFEDMMWGNTFEDEEDFLLKDGLYDKEFHLFREWKPIKYAYGGLVKRLRKSDLQCYMFTYDWRRESEHSGEQLVEFIQHISGRHTQKGKKPEIDFVTHSMGGLVLQSALGLIPDLNLPPQVGRIVFIAPPFRGALDVPKTLIAGEKNGWFSDNEGFRKLARSFPSVYQLIPSFENALVSENGESLAPFNIANWQQNVTQPGKGFQDSFLKNGEAFVRGKSAKLGGTSRAPMLREKTFVNCYGENTLILLGTGHETMWQVPIKKQNPSNPNWFDFENAKCNKLGDGRVHLKSAAVKGVTLAAFDTRNDHGSVCRDETILNAMEMWLNKGHVLKIKPRTLRNSLKRPGRTYFCPWNGDESTFNSHRIKR